MKKTLTINISGSVFHIDEDAYDKLHSYLYEINRHFRNDADAKEILEDIEARISELFQEKLKGANEVVNIDLVNEVIAIMGSPAAFSDAEEPALETETKRRWQTGGQKKLYRDPDDRVLGGVCSGLGAYFNMDPLVFRLIFIITFFLPIGSFLIYLILWIVVPRARNTAQRLEMRGEEVNINNISKSIKDEFQDVKESYRKFRTTGGYSKGQERIHEVGSVFVQILRAVAKVLIVFIGGILVLAGIAAIFALIISLFVTNEFIGITPWGSGIPHYFDLLVDGQLLSWFWIAMGIVIGIPLIMLVYLGIKMIFNIKSPNNWVGSTATAIWLMGLIGLIFVTTKGLSGFKSTSTATTQEAITSKSDTLYLTLGKDEFKDYYDSNINFNNMKVASMNGKNFLLGMPRLTVEKTDANEFSLVIKHQSRGNNLEKAQKYAREIQYKLDIKDSLITLQPWFMIPENSIWRNQEVFMTLKMPENKTVYFDETIFDVLHDVENTTNTWDNDMVRKYWTMKPEGLTMVNRAIPQPVTPQKNKK